MCAYIDLPLRNVVWRWHYLCSSLNNKNFLPFVGKLSQTRIQYTQCLLFEEGGKKHIIKSDQRHRENRFPINACYVKQKVLRTHTKCALKQTGTQRCCIGRQKSTGSTVYKTGECLQGQKVNSNDTFFLGGHYLTIATHCGQ